MKTVDQSHLYPKTRGPRTDMSQLGIEPGPLRWEASTLEKSHPFKQLVNSNSEYLQISVQPVENAQDMAPPSAFVT